MANKMADISSLFGKKLGEEFSVFWYRRIDNVQFDEFGVHIYNRMLRRWDRSDDLLVALLTDEAVILSE